MPFKTLPGGLELVIPTSGTTNWGQTVEADTWVKVNNHAHGGSGDGNQIAASGIADGAVTAAKLANNIALKQQSLAPAGTTQDIDWDDGSKVILDLSSASGDVTLTLSDPIEGGIYRIIFTQGGTKRTLIWPAAVLWQGGEEPSQHSSINSSNIIYLDYDGTSYYTKWDIEFS